MSEPAAPATEVEMPDARTVIVRRRFEAPRDLVYRAYTTPDLLMRWLSGPEWVMSTCEMDLWVGGSYRWRWSFGDQEFGFDGEFREIDAPRRIHNTERFDPGTLGGSMGGEALVTVDFDEAEGGTLLRTQMVYATEVDRDAALETGMTDGMAQTYVELDALLAEQVAEAG